MKVNAIPLGLARERTPETQDPFVKKPSSGDASPSVGGAGTAYVGKPPPARAIVNGQGVGLEFSVDKDTGVTIIKVLDVETGEVIRQIPPEEVLAFMKEFEKNGPLLSHWL